VFVFGWFYFIKIIIFMKSKDIGVGCLLSDRWNLDLNLVKVVSPVELVEVFQRVNFCICCYIKEATNGGFKI
jgi:hypothetical protein